MFGILKYVVGYVRGQKESVDEKYDYKPPDNSFSIKKVLSKDSTCEHEETEDDQLVIRKIEEEVKAIEGWEDEVEQENVEDDVIICEEIESVVNITENQEKEMGCSYEDGGELCQHRIGSVTKAFKDYGIIDHQFRAEYRNINVKSLTEGASVKYIVFRSNVNEEWKLHKIVTIVDENWEEQSKETKTEIVKKLGAIERKIVGMVESRTDQNVTVKPNITFSLGDVMADFVPREGDWLSINALVELDENVQDFVGDILVIHNIQPLRTRIISGSITHWDENRKEGIVDKNVWFSQNECEPGYLPAIEDSVDVEAIECSHGTSTWRAINIIPISRNRLKTNSNTTTWDEENNFEPEPPSYSIKNGMSVPKKIHVGCVNLGETKENYITIMNMGKDINFLFRTRFNGKRSESQITLLTNASNIVINPGKKIYCRFRINGKFVGHFAESIVFLFKGFRLICRIYFKVEDSKIMSLIEKKQQFCADLNDRLSRARNYELNKKSKVIMRGEKLLKPPAFVPVKIGSYAVPDHLWKLVLDENEECDETKRMSSLIEAVPCLTENLNVANYETRFHTLLYLEEIDVNIQIRKYDLEGIKLSFVGDQYLSLEVPGLAEKRPSVLMGDSVNVESSRNPGCLYEGFVHKVCANELWLKFHPQFHQIYESEECSVHFVIGRTPFRKCHFAIDIGMRHLGENVLFPKTLIEKEPQVNLIEDKNDSTTYVPFNHSIRSVGSKNNFFEPSKQKYSDNGIPIRPAYGQNDLPSLPAPKISKKAVTLKWFNSSLNHCQKEAVRNAVKGVARPLPYVIFGPPGTGKTVTLVETILQIYSLIPDSRILVATPSNSSANLIAERLLISKVLCPGDLVRLMAWHCLEEGTVPESLLPYSTSCDLGSSSSGEFSRITYKLKKSSNASVLGRHRITVGTCVALGQLYSMGFPSGHFTHVCVDEAGQATEPELLIPVAFLHKDWGQIILAGDPMQLGPVVNSKIAKHWNLGYSYLARLLDSSLYLRHPDEFSLSGGFNPKLITRLVMNYRSLPEILYLPSSLFYDSHLQPQVEETGQEVSILKSLASYLPQRDTPLPPSLVFHGLRGINYRELDCPSWFNPHELVQIINYLISFYKTGLTPDDIGVITPYQKQVQKLRTLLCQLEIPSPKIGSVEEFQGQERQVILVSTVRSTVKYVKEDVRHALGFVACAQRLNVAITRARALLIVIGNPFLLKRDPYWRRTLAYCLDNKAYVGCELPRDFIDQSNESSCAKGEEQFNDNS